jgi:hypothetical protein
MNSTDFQKRFDPGFLITGKAPLPSGSSFVPSVILRDAVYLYSSPILQELRKAPQQQDQAYALQDKVKAQLSSDVPFDQFSEVLNYLQRDGVIDFVQRDARGNHLVKLR